LLSAVGIKTNIENIGIATDKDKILVNEYYNTTYQVYAIGDVTPDSHWLTSLLLKELTVWKIAGIHVDLSITEMYQVVRMLLLSCVCWFN
jgi:dihydrolipoamide dehydrogenase